MTQPERPFFEENVPEPRQGMRLSVQLCDAEEVALAPTTDVDSQILVVAKLSVEQAADVYKQSYVRSEGPREDFHGQAIAIQTIYSFLLFGSHGRADHQYETDINIFVNELGAGMPFPERSIYLDTPLVPDEALHPEQLDNPNVLQFILTRKKPQYLRPV